MYVKFLMVQLLSFFFIANVNSQEHDEYHIVTLMNSLNFEITQFYAKGTLSNEGNTAISPFEVTVEKQDENHQIIAKIGNHEYTHMIPFSELNGEIDMHSVSVNNLSFLNRFAINLSFRFGEEFFNDDCKISINNFQQSHGEVTFTEHGNLSIKYLHFLEHCDIQEVYNTVQLSKN